MSMSKQRLGTSKKQKPLKPAMQVSPGTILNSELQARGWSPRVFAELTGISAKTVDEIIHGKTLVNSKLANCLAKALGTSSEVWLNLEASYRSYLIEQAGSGALNQKSVS